jgi:hypothetical protein
MERFPSNEVRLQARAPRLRYPSPPLGSLPSPFLPQGRRSMRSTVGSLALARYNLHLAIHSRRQRKTIDSMPLWQKFGLYVPNVQSSISITLFAHADATKITSPGPKETPACPGSGLHCTHFQSSFSTTLAEGARVTGALDRVEPVHLRVHVRYQCGGREITE